jgi:hypothetical protein
MERNTVPFPCQVWVSATELGKAQITATEANGVTRGPFVVNYQLIPLHELFIFNFSKPRQLVNGKVPDTFGRLPGESGYNTAYAPGKDPFSQSQQMLSNGVPTDEYGRVLGDPGYNTCFAPGQSPFDHVDAMGRMPTVKPLQQPWQSNHSHSQNHFANQLPSQGQFNSIWPCTDIMRPYMAGVGLMVARARLAQQTAINNGLDVNAYQYAYNNPVNYVDPEGMKPTKPTHPHPKLKPCPAGWEAGKGSVTKCNQPHMGMKQMYCQYCGVYYGPTCSCNDLSGIVGRQYVAIKGSKLVCGATLQIMNRSTGETKTVTVIDEGPYANDAIVDISEDVFGIPAASTWHVCIGPISSSSSPAGWKVCQQGSQGT